MSDTRNLSNAEAVEKLKHIARGETAMFCTFNNDRSMATRPMATLDVGDDGTLWFFSGRTSKKNEAIATNPQVQLIYSVPGKSEYMMLNGIATISRDRQKIDQYWNVWAKNWFPEGKDDPELTVIMVTAFAGHYWDTKSNRMIQMAKVAVGAIIGKTLEDGVEGKLTV